MAREMNRQRPPYVFVLLGTFFLCLCLIRYQNFISTTEWTHLMTLESVASGNGIDLKSSPGPLDASPVGSKIIPNKPPGLITLLSPFHSALKWSTGWVDPAKSYKGLLWVSCLCTAGIAAVGFLLLLRLGLPPMPALISCLGIVFCSDLVLYAPMLTRHTAAALLAVTALASPLISLGRSGFSPLLAGLCLGLLPAFDYSTLVIAGVLALGLGFIHRLRYGTSALLSFLVGLLLPLAALLTYNHQVYGSLLTTGYTPGVFVESEAVQWNGWKGAFLDQPLTGLIPGLVGPGRGILLLCPPLLIGLWALFKGKNAKWTLLEKVALAAAGAHLIFISSFRFWHGGNFPGHRYLIPLIILMIPTWARILGPMLKQKRIVAGLWIASGAAVTYRIFLVWTWSEPASQSLWDSGSDSQGAPLFSTVDLIQRTLSLPHDPLIGEGLFETSKLIFLALGIVFFCLAWLRVSFMQGEAVYKSTGAQAA